MQFAVDPLVPTGLDSQIITLEPKTARNLVLLQAKIDVISPNYAAGSIIEIYMAGRWNVSLPWSLVTPENNTGPAIFCTNRLQAGNPLAIGIRFDTGIDKIFGSLTFLEFT